MFKSGNKITALFMSFVLVVTSLSFSITAQAASTSELNSRKSKIQSEINDTQKKLNELSAQKKETEEYKVALMSKINLLQDKIDTLESEKDALQKEIDAIQTKIKNTENEIIAAQNEIDAKQAEFDENYETYSQRLRAMYVSGAASNLEVLLTSTDMSAMFTRSQMIKSVAEKDSAVLDELMKTMEEIENQKQALQVKIKELGEDKDNLEVDKKELQSRLDEISSSKSELDKEAAECNALIKKLGATSSEYMELIETDRKKLQQVEDDIRRAAAAASTGSGKLPGSTGSGKGSGRLRYPTNSTAISAGYPNYSSGGYHGGVDFSVPAGSNIYAAASGKVILVKYLNYSYGYHVQIDHGNGLSTLYAHNSAINVSVGQQVTAGQVIAASGNTGNSTGPHCHFEVRVNGNRVNPMAYL